MRWWWLFGVFAIIFAFRLFFAFQSPFFTSDAAYLNVRYVDTIVASGRALWTDSLGYGGRTLLLSPLFAFLLAVWNVVMPLFFVLKIIPNLFASLIVVPVFLIVRQMTGRDWIAIVCAFLSGLSPVFVSKTFNHVSSLSLVIPLFFFLLYALLNPSDRRWAATFVLGSVFFALLHPLSLVFVLGFVLFLALTKIEHLRVSASEWEMALFSLCFVVWSQFLLYKQAVLEYGAGVVWLNVPHSIMNSVFSSASVLEILWKVGVIPLIAGLYVLYALVFRDRGRGVYLIFSYVIFLVVLLWLKVISLWSTIILLSIFFVLLFGKALRLIEDFLKEVRFFRGKSLILPVLLVVVFVILAFSVVSDVRAELRATIGGDEVAALNWISGHTRYDAVVLAPVDQGHYVTALANRSVVMDDFFLLAPRVDERLRDVRRVFRTVLETEVVELLDNYNASLVYVPPGVDFPVSSSPCFNEVFSGPARVYEKDVGCHVEVVS